VHFSLYHTPGTSGFIQLFSQIHHLKVDEFDVQSSAFKVEKLRTLKEIFDSSKKNIER